MTMNSKIQSIDQKIADLKKRKVQIAQKHLQTQARLIQKCGLEDLSPEILAGALMDVKQQIPQKQEEWLQAGAMFLQPKRTAKVQKAADQDAEN